MELVYPVSGEDRSVGKAKRTTRSGFPAAMSDDGGPDARVRSKRKKYPNVAAVPPLASSSSRSRHTMRGEAGSRLSAEAKVTGITKRRKGRRNSGGPGSSADDEYDEEEQLLAANLELIGIGGASTIGEDDRMMGIGAMGTSSASSSYGRPNSSEYVPSVGPNNIYPCLSTLSDIHGGTGSTDGADSYGDDESMSSGADSISNFRSASQSAHISTRETSTSASKSPSSARHPHTGSTGLGIPKSGSAFSNFGTHAVASHASHHGGNSGVSGTTAAPPRFQQHHSGAGNNLHAPEPSLASSITSAFSHTQYQNHGNVQFQPHPAGAFHALSAPNSSRTPHGPTATEQLLRQVKTLETIVRHEFACLTGRQYSTLLELIGRMKTTLEPPKANSDVPAPKGTKTHSSFTPYVPPASPNTSSTSIASNATAIPAINANPGTNPAGSVSGTTTGSAGNPSASNEDIISSNGTTNNLVTNSSANSVSSASAASTTILTTSHVASHASSGTNISQHTYIPPQLSTKPYLRLGRQVQDAGMQTEPRSHIQLMTSRSGIPARYAGRGDAEHALKQQSKRGNGNGKSAANGDFKRGASSTNTSSSGASGASANGSSSANVSSVSGVPSSSGNTGNSALRGALAVERGYSHDSSPVDQDTMAIDEVVRAARIGGSNIVSAAPSSARISAASTEEAELNSGVDIYVPTSTTSSTSTTNGTQPSSTSSTSIISNNQSAINATGGVGGIGSGSSSSIGHPSSGVGSSSSHFGSMSSVGTNTNASSSMQGIGGAGAVSILNDSLHRSGSSIVDRSSGSRDNSDRLDQIDRGDGSHRGTNPTLNLNHGSSSHNATESGSSANTGSSGIGSSGIGGAGGTNLRVSGSGVGGTNGGISDAVSSSTGGVVESSVAPKGSASGSSANVGWHSHFDLLRSLDESEEELKRDTHVAPSSYQGLSSPHGSYGQGNNQPTFKTNSRNTSRYNSRGNSLQVSSGSGGSGGGRGSHTNNASSASTSTVLSHTGLARPDPNGPSGIGAGMTPGGAAKEDAKGMRQYLRNEENGSADSPHSSSSHGSPADSSFTPSPRRAPWVSSGSKWAISPLTRRGTDHQREEGSSVDSPGDDGMPQPSASRANYHRRQPSLDDTNRSEAEESSESQHGTPVPTELLAANAQPQVTRPSHNLHATESDVQVPTTVRPQHVPVDSGASSKQIATSEPSSKADKKDRKDKNKKKTNAPITFTGVPAVASASTTGTTLDSKQSQGPLFFSPRSAFAPKRTSDTP